MRRQVWRGLRVVTWQFGKAAGDEQVVRREQGGKGARVVRWQ